MNSCPMPRSRAGSIKNIKKENTNGPYTPASLSFGDCVQSPNGPAAHTGLFLFSLSLYIIPSFFLRSFLLL